MLIMLVIKYMEYTKKSKEKKSKHHPLSYHLEITTVNILGHFYPIFFYAETKYCDII